MLRILPPELVGVVLSFIVDDDSEYVVLRQVSKLFEIKPRRFEAKVSRFVINIDRLTWAKLTAVLGICGLVHLLPKKEISKFSSGQQLTDVPGAHGPARLPPKGVTWKFSSG